MSMGEGQQVIGEPHQLKKEGTQTLRENNHQMGEGQLPKIEVQQSIGEGQQTQQGDGQKPKPQRQISICPMCQGKGYYEEIGKPEINYYKKNDAARLHRSITPQQHPQYKLEQIFKAGETKTLSRVSDSAVPMSVPRPNSRFPPVHIPHTGGRKTFTAGQVKSSPNNTSNGSFPQLVNLLPAPKKLEKHPEEAAQQAAKKLNSTQWEDKKTGLEDCLQLSNFNPEELEQYMSLVYRAMSALLHNFRPQVTIFVCQAAREFFAQMRSICRPEFDELVYALLSRTADKNKYIRLYANDALDKMVTYIPTVHAVRPLVEKGPVHNNPLVRTASARLLTCIVALRTPNVILTHPSLRETCKRIVETAALLLGDSNLDTRAAAKKLFQRFINEDEFESIYYAEVDEKIRKRVERAFVELKYKNHMQV